MTDATEKAGILYRQSCLLRELFQELSGSKTLPQRCPPLRDVRRDVEDLLRELADQDLVVLT